MDIIVSLLALMCLATGMVLNLISYRYRTELGRSIPWYKSKYFLVPGKIMEVLTPEGKRVYRMSTILIGVGLGLALVANVDFFYDLIKEILY